MLKFDPCQLLNVEKWPGGHFFNGVTVEVRVREIPSENIIFEKDIETQRIYND